MYKLAGVIYSGRVFKGILVDKAGNKILKVLSSGVYRRVK